MRPVDAFIDSCTKLIHQEQHDGVLWHYTTVEALIKIVQTSSIHLNCYNFMNDQPKDRRRQPSWPDAGTQRSTASTVTRTSNSTTSAARLMT